MAFIFLVSAKRENYQTKNSTSEEKERDGSIRKKNSMQHRRNNLQYSKTNFPTRAVFFYKLHHTSAKCYNIIDAYNVSFVRADDYFFTGRQRAQPRCQRSFDESVTILSDCGRPQLLSIMLNYGRICIAPDDDENLNERAEYHSRFARLP